MRLSFCWLLLMVAEASAQPQVDSMGEGPRWHLQTDVGVGPSTGTAVSVGVSRTVWGNVSLGATAYQSIDVIPCDDCIYAPATVGEVRASWLPKVSFLAPRVFVAVGVLRGRTVEGTGIDEFRPTPYPAYIVTPQTRPYALAGAGLDLIFTRRVGLGVAVQSGVAEGLDVTRASAGLRVGF